MFSKQAPAAEDLGWCDVTILFYLIPFYYLQFPVKAAKFGYNVGEALLLPMTKDGKNCCIIPAQVTLTNAQVHQFIKKKPVLM